MTGLAMGEAKRMMCLLIYTTTVARASLFIGSLSSSNFMASRGTFSRQTTAKTCKNRSLPLFEFRKSRQTFHYIALLLKIRRVNDESSKRILSGRKLNPGLARGRRGY